MEADSSKNCNQCHALKPLNAFYRHKKTLDGYYGHCKECHSLTTKRWYKDNKGKRRELDAIWKANNKARFNYLRRRMYKKNPRKYIDAATERNYVLKRAIPKWADISAIREFYANCPAGYEVDHIYPLRGELCSGLHVLNNLQYLPKTENARKSNKMPEF